MLGGALAEQTDPMKSRKENTSFSGRFGSWSQDKKTVDAGRYRYPEPEESTPGRLSRKASSIATTPPRRFLLY